MAEDYLKPQWMQVYLTMILLSLSIYGFINPSAMTIATGQMSIAGEPATQYFINLAWIFLPLSLIIGLYWIYKTNE